MKNRLMQWIEKQCDNRLKARAQKERERLEAAGMYLQAGLQAGISQLGQDMREDIKRIAKEAAGKFDLPPDDIVSFDGEAFGAALREAIRVFQEPAPPRIIPLPGPCFSEKQINTLREYYEAPNGEEAKTWTKQRSC